MSMDFLQLFLGGVVVGSSSCLLFCSPIVIPYIFGTSNNWRRGLAAAFIFSLGRITSCAFYGLLIGLGKYVYIDKFADSQFNLQLQIFAGLFILLIGFLLVLGRKRKTFCPGFEKLLIKHNLKTVFMLGLFMGIMPCPPLIAVFTFVFFKAGNLVSSFLLVLAFGLGTIFSPMLILGAFSGFIAQKLSGKNIRRILRVLSGIILIFWGLQILMSKMGFVVRL